jgi:hypothetical protein
MPSRRRSPARCRARELRVWSIWPRSTIGALAGDRRASTIVAVDNISVSLHDPAAHRLRTIFARGVHADQFLQDTMAEDEGISGVVLASGEAQLIQDELAEPRVAHHNGKPEPGALIAAPLRGQERTQGVLLIERLGPEARFAARVRAIKLFAHVRSLRNAAAHRAVDPRRTDRLTGLLRHGALTEHPRGWSASAPASGCSWSTLTTSRSTTTARPPGGQRDAATRCQAARLVPRHRPVFRFGRRVRRAAA